MADYRDFRSEKSRDRGSYRKCRVLRAEGADRDPGAGAGRPRRVWWPPSGTAPRATSRRSSPPTATPSSWWCAQARALVLGLGYEMLTPPARVRVTHDRFSHRARRPLPMVASRPCRPFPPRRLKATGFRPTAPACMAARRRICAGPRPRRSSTRSASRCRVSRAATRTSPAAGGMATKRQWIDSAPWERGYTGMGGDEASQLSGDREVVAVRAGRRNALRGRDRDQGGSQGAAYPGGRRMPRGAPGWLCGRRRWPTSSVAPTSSGSRT